MGQGREEARQKEGGGGATSDWAYCLISQGHPGTQALSLCLFGAFGVAFFLSCFPDSRFLSRFFCVCRLFLFAFLGFGLFPAQARV